MTGSPSQGRASSTSGLVQQHSVVARQQLADPALDVVGQGRSTGARCAVRCAFGLTRLSIYCAAAMVGYIAKHQSSAQGLADTTTTFIAGRLAATSLSAEGVVILVAMIALLRQRGSPPPDTGGRL